MCSGMQPLCRNATSAAIELMVSKAMHEIDSRGPNRRDQKGLTA